MGSLKACLDRVVADGLLTKPQRDEVSSYFRSKAKEMAEEGHEGSPTERHIEAVSELLEKVKAERESILKQAKVTTRLKPSEANVEPSSQPTGASSAVASKPALQKGEKVSSGAGPKQARGGSGAAQAKAAIADKPKETPFERMARLNREQWMGVGATGRKQTKAKPVEKQEPVQSTEAKDSATKEKPKDKEIEDNEEEAALLSDAKEEFEEMSEHLDEVSAQDMLRDGFAPAFMEHVRRMAFKAEEFGEFIRQGVKDFGAKFKDIARRAWKVVQAMIIGATGFHATQSDTAMAPPSGLDLQSTFAEQSANVDRSTAKGSVIKLAPNSAPLVDAAPLRGIAVMDGNIQSGYGKVKSISPAEINEFPGSSVKKADMGGESVSDPTRKMADWVVAKNDSKGSPFVIADKDAGTLSMFDAEGKLVQQVPALFGKEKGDTIDAYQTPSGRFAINDTNIGPYTVEGGKVVPEMGNVIDVVETPDSVVAIHRIYTGRPQEERPVRLATKDPNDNRISYGCINLDSKVMEETLLPLFEDGGMVYILPETKKGRKKFERETGYSFEQAKEWANNAVREGNLNAGLNPRLLAAHAIRSADWIAQNGAKFGEWSKAMLKDFGQSISRHLQRIWRAAQEAVAEGALKWLERTGGIKYMSDNTGRPAAPERPAGRPAFSKWQDMGVGDIKLQAEALDNAWKAFRGQGKSKKLTDAQITEGWAEEIANPDSPFISRAIKQMKSADAPKQKQAPKTVEGEKVEPHPIPAGEGFFFGIPLLTKMDKGYALAGKPLEGAAGDIPVSGLKGISQLKDGEIELYKQLVPEAFSGDKVNVPKLAEGLAKNGPVVEIKKLSDKASGNEERLAELDHIFETQGVQPFGDVRNDDSIYLAHVDDGERIENPTPEQKALLEEYFRLANDDYETRQSNVAKYRSVSPKAESDMPGYVEALVRVPLRPLKDVPENQRDLQLTENPLYEGPHFGSEDTNVVSFFRGYMETTPDGKKVFHVIEVQSDWAQMQRSTSKMEVRQAGPESFRVVRDGDDSIGFTTRREAEEYIKKIQSAAHDHPLLAVYESLALKAAIKHAQENGATHIALGDGEGVMMNEGHDIVIKQARDEVVHLNKLIAQDKLLEADRTRTSLQRLKNRFEQHGAQFEVKDGQIVMTREPFVTGMKFHYDQTLPKELKRLTGSEGERVEFGVHAKAIGNTSDSREYLEDMGGEVTEIGGGRFALVTGSPAFLENGKPKRSNSARMWELNGVDEHRAVLLFSDPFFFQVFRSSFVDIARATGSLARFTSRIVKQFGQWIAQHAKALWTAAAKGAEHVGEYLKGVVEAAKKTSQVGAISPGGTVTYKIPTIGKNNSISVTTRKKTNALLAGITAALKAPGERTASGLLVDRSKMGPVRKLIHDVAGNVVSEARRIHAVLGAAMEHLDFRSAQLAKIYETLMNPSWTKVFKKLNDKQDTALRIAYLSGNVKAQHDIVREVAGEEGVKLYEQAIKNYETFYNMAIKAGLKLNKVGRYLPTRLKAGAYPELLSILRKHGMMDDISRVLKKTDKDIAGMDQFEGAEVMQQALASIFGPAGNRHFKSRTGVALDARVMDEIAPLYETFDNVIGHYGVQLTDAIVRAEALGPDSIKNIKEYMEGDRSEDNGVPDGSPLGLVFEGLRRDGEVNEQDMLRFNELVKARFGYLPDGFVEKWLKSGNMSLALANPFSAIRQIGSEIIKSLFRNGVLPTLLGIKDALKGRGISVTRDLFLSPDFEIGMGNDPIKRLNTILAKLSGFRAADLFPANVIANAALHRLKALSREGRIKEIAVLKDSFGKDTTVEEVADKIGRGEFNDPDVWRVAWHELTALRPTGLGTRPIAVLRNRGLARVAYNLKEWGITSLNFMKETTYDNIRSGDPEKVKLGLQGLSLLTTGLILAGASGDAIVDWLLGKDVQFDEKVKENALKMVLASRYQVGQVMGTNGQKPSIKDALLNYMSTPTLSMFDSMAAAAVKSAQDDEKSFMDIALKDKQLARIVPLGIGTAYFAWSGESGESDRAKQVEQRLPEQVLQLTEETSKLRALGEDGRKKSLQATRRWSQLSAFSKIKSWRTKLATEAAKMRDYSEAESQLSALDKISKSPHLWDGEAARIERLKEARKSLGLQEI